ncbi:DUF6705 family protein [Chryseobacterium sp. Chry.R1]|uniref:DUF6705 family protein n=1 Tax=unclassified Chryseobacterium TaxID=2593645 RepID=UPI0015527C5D|nr:MULTISPECIES: DUF6705 family protein [unclassified Chryseobacterium]MDC8103086.1 hypothetical protein [Chryseobacterium sp. B21-037]
MKIHFKIFLIAGLIINFISCKAQQQYPLNTDYEDIPNNSYLKDLNHELDPYVGKYKANYQGNEIIIFITKVDNKLEKSTHKSYFTDALVVKYIIKNSSGTILQDTQSMVLNNDSYFNIVSIGTRPTLGDIIFIYDGTNCGIGWGKIILKKINSNQISWEYKPNSLVIDAATCPPSTDKTVYLPETKGLVFTKQ